MVRLNSLTTAVSGLFLVLTSACSNASSGPNTKQLSLSFSNKPASAPSIMPSNGVSLLTQVDAGGNTLVITKAQVVLSKIELASTSTAVCTDDNMSNASECEELKAEPTIVDLPTDPTAVQTALVSTVPPGSYTDFEGKVRVVQSTDLGGAAFLAAHPSFTGVSVHVEGTWTPSGGSPASFSYDGTANAELELAFSTPLVVDGSNPMNITVNVDLGAWFMGGSGNLVDPATAGSGGANESMVAHNIHQSFEAFEDENHDGHDDHKP